MHFGGGQSLVGGVGFLDVVGTQEQLRVRAERPRAQGEAVQVVVIPAERGLDDLVHDVQREVRAHVQSSPDGWSGPVQIDVEAIDAWVGESGAAELGPGRILRREALDTAHDRLQIRHSGVGGGLLERARQFSVRVRVGGGVLGHDTTLEGGGAALERWRRVESGDERCCSDYRAERTHGPHATAQGAAQDRSQPSLLPGAVGDRGRPQACHTELY